MPPCCAFLVLFLSMAVQAALPLSTAQTPQRPVKQDKPGIDAHGDPLPQGAVTRLGTVRLRHLREIHQLLYSPNGKSLVSASVDRTVRFWDPKTGREVRRLPETEISSRLGGFSPDGKVLVTFCETCHFWDADSGQELPWSPARQKEKDPCDNLEVQFSPDGRYLATVGLFRELRAGEKELSFLYRVWEVPTGKLLLRVFEPPPEYTYHQIWVLTSDGKILTADLDKVGLVREVGSGKVRYQFPTAVKGGNKSPVSGKVETYSPLEFLSKGEQLFVWVGFVSPRPKMGKDRPATFAIPPPQASPPEESSTSGYAVLDLASGKERSRLPEHHRRGLSPDGRYTVGAVDKSVSIWEVATGKPIRQIPCPNRLHFAQFSPDARKLACVDLKGHTRVWDLVTGKLLLEIHFRGTDIKERGYALPSLAFSPDGNQLAFCDAAAPVIELWDLTTGKQSLSREGHFFAIEKLIYAPGGKSLVSVAGEELLRWDIETGRMQARQSAQIPEKTVRTFWGSKGTVQALVSSGQKKALQLWDVASSKLLRTLDQGGELGEAMSLMIAVSPNGKWLATTGDPEVVLWNLETGRKVWTVRSGSLKNPNMMGTLTFSPDGKALAARGIWITTDPIIHGVIQWEVLTGKERRRQEWKGASWARTFRNTNSESSPLDEPRGALLHVPGGNLLILGGPQTLWLLEPGKAGEIRRFGGREALSETAALSPDGKLLAALTSSGTVQLWDVATGTALDPIRPPSPVRITCFAFSPRGRHLATGCNDTTILIWDLEQVPIRPAAPALKALEPLWQALSDDDATKADQAIQALTAQPAEAVAFLKTRLMPQQSPDFAKLKHLIAELDSSKYANREKARVELIKLGDLVLPALREAVAAKNSLEVVRRLEALLVQLEGPPCSPELLRHLRAVEVLEQIATAEARQVLASLAGGMAGHRVTQEAADSLRRLKRANEP